MAAPASSRRLGLASDLPGRFHAGSALRLGFMGQFWQEDGGFCFRHKCTGTTIQGVKLFENAIDSIVLGIED
jgi:hypothetical protein